MEIIKKTEGLTPADLYALTKGNDVRKMADAKGEVLDILKYVLYKDEDTKGNEMIVLAVETVDGAKYATTLRLSFATSVTFWQSLVQEMKNRLPGTSWAVDGAKATANT